jgi:hypothetical protein
VAGKTSRGLPKPISTRDVDAASRTSSRPGTAGPSRGSTTAVIAFAEQVLAGKNRQMIAQSRTPNV